MRETFAQLVMRANRNAFIPPKQPTGVAKMPKAVKLGKGKEFTFRASGGKGGVSKYAWDEWFNPDPNTFPGGLVELERSTMQSTNEKDARGNTIHEIVPGPGNKRDYEVSTDQMVPKIKAAARKRYKVVQVSRFDNNGRKLEDALIIRSRDMTADERVAEDIKRAEEKAARDAKGEEEEIEGEEDTSPTPMSNVG